jgi:hypothetical protein
MRMKVKIDIEPYDNGLSLKYRADAEITVYTEAETQTTVIRANADGWKTLAAACMTLAQENVPAGSHLHLDEWNFFEKGSREIILTRI